MKFNLKNTDYNDLFNLLSPKDVILVTGGTGGIASSIVRYLLLKVKSQFLLVGRNPQPAEWIELEGSGRVQYLMANIGNKDAVSKLKLSKRGITLILHAAGLSALRPIKEIKNSEMAQILAVKILGLHNILENLGIRTMLQPMPIWMGFHLHTHQYLP